MQTPVHNKELISAVEDLRKRKIIRQDNDIVEKTGYSKSTVSGYISGNVKASSKFINEFENQFKIRLIDYADSANGRQKPTDPLTGAHVTLQDYIDKQEQRIAELKRDKDMLYALLNSNLVSLKEGQQIMIAYQKAWVDHVAERESKGDQRKKEEIAYKMGKLVDDILMGDSYTGTHVESGKHHKG